MIHFASPRADQACVSLNCAAFPSDLIEAELFGIEDRAATNVKGRIGIFEQAHGGTLFLDEIGDIPLAVQVKLLRVLQEREFVPIGGSKVRPVDFRLITATNQDLPGLIAKGLFRDDLYFRIHHLAIHIPPLRERKIDILLLAEHFLKIFCDENGRPLPPMSAAFKSVLLKSNWEGNVRELQNYVERIAVMSGGPTLEPIFLPRDLERLETAKPSRSSLELLTEGIEPETGSHRSAVDEFERGRILRALHEAAGNQRQAAISLGLKESTLRYNMRKLGVVSPGARRRAGRRSPETPARK
jgi:transcriptional regulator with GAF, ATPase, and Fis domain